MALEFAAIILAAGESRRMGQPKLVLPWGSTTILGQVLATFSTALAGLPAGDDPSCTGYELLVVTGGNRAVIEQELDRLSGHIQVQRIHNPEYQQGGMISSIQCGLRALCQAGSEAPEAVLVGLGDQPQVQVDTIRRVCLAHRRHLTPLVVPSYRQRRGHPWLMSRSFWSQFLALPVSTTPRMFLAMAQKEITYVPANATIFQDIDFPAEYVDQRPPVPKG